MSCRLSKDWREATRRFNGTVAVGQSESDQQQAVPVDRAWFRVCRAHAGVRPALGMRPAVSGPGALLASHAAGEEGVAVDLERACIDFADRAAERVDRRSNGDVFES